MTKPTDLEIECRAYALWEQAGMPNGRDQEFYLQAERELGEAVAKEDQGGPKD